MSRLGAVLGMLSLTGCSAQVAPAALCPIAPYDCAWEQPIETTPDIVSCTNALSRCEPMPCAQSADDAGVVTLTDDAGFVAKCWPPNAAQ